MPYKIVIEDDDVQDSPTPIMISVYENDVCNTGMWMDKLEINGDFMTGFVDGSVTLSKNIKKYTIEDIRKGKK
jgi:hypothetical protein